MLGKERNNLFEFNFFNNDKIEKVISNNKEVEYNILFVLFFFWKVLNDVKYEGDVRDWGMNDYYNFFIENIDKINLNEEKYKVGIKDCIKYIIRDVKYKC